MIAMRRAKQRQVRIPTLGRPTPALLRHCPKCGAAPNQSCVRVVSARVEGVETGGGYTVRLKNVHPERKRRPVDGEQ